MNMSETFAPVPKEMLVVFVYPCPFSSQVTRIVSLSLVFFKWIDFGHIINLMALGVDDNSSSSLIRGYSVA